ncbi:MAG: HD domain-containing protein [Bdellovibrionota bacterium]
MNRNLLQPTTTVSFADVAHGTLIFDQKDESERLILELIDTRWMQRLRAISQTGNTRLVYMFAEHSRFGHCLGVAYLAVSLMKHLRETTPELVRPYSNAVAAAALLHDVGHISPGSHLAERIWSPESHGHHEQVSIRVILEDPEISSILKRYGPDLPALVTRILAEDESLPPWTHEIISGGGWNADRGNWAIVDSAMCAVSYGRYNVSALIDAFRLSSNGEMVLHESRLDALTHFFVARDSMYRQVYQHRVLQAVDSMTQKVVLRLRDLISTSGESPRSTLERHGVFVDDTMLAILTVANYGEKLALEQLFDMTEAWWRYHIERWCRSGDKVLSDLATRHRDRRLFKTIRMQEGGNSAAILEQVKAVAAELGFDPRYYVTSVEDADAHRGKQEQAPKVLLDDGTVMPVTDVEPMIAQILTRPQKKRRWLSVPREVKAKLGFIR